MLYWTGTKRWTPQKYRCIFYIHHSDNIKILKCVAANDESGAIWNWWPQPVPRQPPVKFKTPKRLSIVKKIKFSQKLLAECTRRLTNYVRSIQIIRADIAPHCCKRWFHARFWAEYFWKGTASRSCNRPQSLQPSIKRYISQVIKLIHQPRASWIRIEFLLYQHTIYALSSVVSTKLRYMM